MEGDSRGMAEMIQRVLDVVAPRVEDVAEDAGLSAHTIWAWAKKRRNPSPESLRKLAAELERRGGKLQELAQELKDAAGEGEGPTS